MDDIINGAQQRLTRSAKDEAKGRARNPQLSYTGARYTCAMPPSMAVGPVQSEFTRIFLPFRSVVGVRANERT